MLEGTKPFGVLVDSTENPDQEVVLNNLSVQENNDSFPNQLALAIDNSLQFSIIQLKSKAEIKPEEKHISLIQTLLKENTELKKLNEIFEREINLLKSLILINNLNLSSSDSKPLCNDKYFIDMCNEQNVMAIVNDDKLYKQQQILHTLIIKINNLKEQLDLFKKEFDEVRSNFLTHMDFNHNKIIEVFINEISNRKRIEEKVTNIKKLI